MHNLSHRTARFTDSVIRRMTRIANEYDAINLSQGFPDFNPPQILMDSLESIAQQPYHQYSVTWGAQNFREAVAAKQSRFTGLSIDANENVVITCGSTEAMLCAVLSVTDPGDKIIIFSPFYENYQADAILAGAEPIFVPLVPPEYSFDEEILEEAFMQDAKALILCNPSNPSGKVFTRSELETIANLAEKYNTYIITDEVYEHMVYAPFRHIYFSALPGMWERTITCSSLSKTYSITGWRLGYTIAPAHITDRLKKVHDFLTVGAPAPLQQAAICALKSKQTYYDDFIDMYTKKRNLFLDGLDTIGLKHNVPQGAYYVMVDIEEFGYESDLVFCEEMCKRVGVAAVPGSSFFRGPIHNYIRLNYAKKEETINEVINRLGKLKDVM
ncbi:MAG: pyridoxal phosphate-dependent aminotransferase [Eggerthellaceae bacterium]|jgi:aspartate/methionine/tyrosine aminotransferase